MSGKMGFKWLLLLLSVIFAQSHEQCHSESEGRDHWVAAWTAMPQEVEPENLPPPPFNDGHCQFFNATLRQTFQLSTATEKLRVQFSNIFGVNELEITSAAIALPIDGEAGASEIQANTSRQLFFSGQPSVVIPAGKTAYSDSIAFTADSQTNVAVTIFLERGQHGTKITGHPGSRTTSWAQSGDMVGAPTISESSVVHWYFASSIEALTPKTTSALVVLGDSITDGRGSEDNKNNRWPDLLVTRMNEEGLYNVTIGNEAAGGNAVLSGGLGPPLIHRYHRDAFEVAGVRYVMVLEGVNDIGPSQPSTHIQQEVYEGLTKAYSQISIDCKARGLLIIGATIPPFSGDGQPYSDPTREETRIRVNEWIKTSGAFDYVVDFSAAISDGHILLSEYDSGDHLHPNVAGYQAMAAVFPLEIFH